MHAQTDTQLLSLRISPAQAPPGSPSREEEADPLSGHPSAKMPGMDAVDENNCSCNVPIGFHHGFPGGSVVKNLPANAGYARDVVQSLGWDDTLEKEIVTHCSTLAWKIPWTEEPGGLQSMRSQRVGHD